MSKTLPLILFLALILLMGPACSLIVAKASITGHSQSSMQYDVASTFSGNSTSNETQWTGFTGAQGVAIGDLYNNGSEETAVSEGVAGTVIVVKSDGKTIARQFTGLEEPFGVAIGDLYNNGTNVIAIAETGASRVTVIDGTVVNYFQGLDQPVGVAIGDLYNDHQNVIAISDNGSGSVIVLKGNGAVVHNFTGFSQPEGVAIGDFNNDGKNEMAIADSGTNEVYVIDSNGNIVMEWRGLGQPMGVAIGDYDNLGLNEIAISETYPVGKVTVYADNGTTIVANWTNRNDPTGVAIGNVYNNGKNELVFTEVSNLTVEVSNAEANVPEFPSFVFVPALMAAALVAVIICRKRDGNPSSSFRIQTRDKAGLIIASRSRFSSPTSKSSGTVFLFVGSHSAFVEECKVFYAAIIPKENR